MTNDRAKTLNDGIRKLVEQLANETDAARQSELFAAYLRVCGLFHNYSWHNCMLIWTHRPDARHVAGFQTWKKMGRYVKAGSKGIPIFAPMFFKERNEDTGEDSQRIWFRVVYVFDVAQTDGQPLPDLPTGCDGDGEPLSERLLTFADSRGITVETRKLDGTAKGYAENKGTRIALDSDLSSGERAAVLIHEISHCLLHFAESKPNCKQRELEAEATAFVVASHFGLAPQSGFYLASYGITAADLLESLPTIQQTATAIISACESRPEPVDIAA